MIGMELVDAATRKPAKKLCDDVITRAFHNGLLLLSCGTSTVRFMPPLMIASGDVDEAMTLLETALGAGDRSYEFVTPRLPPVATM